MRERTPLFHPRDPRYRNPLDPKYTEGYRPFFSTDKQFAEQARTKPKGPEFDHQDLEDNDLPRPNPEDVRLQPAPAERESRLKYASGKDLDPKTLLDIYEQSGEPLPPDLQAYKDSKGA